VGLALQPASTVEFAALWYAGVGLAWNPASWLGVGLELSYLVEDSGFRGFWDIGAGDREGWAGSVRFAFSWGGGSRSSGGGSVNVPPPSSSGPSEPMDLPAAPAEPLSSEGTALAYDIVDTAIGVMGEPYRWGGTSTEQGFDCSGLIYFAYGEHDLSIPRVSRDQARAGRSVPRDVGSLAPGDILLFANGGSGVNHVGLYVGNRRFIHATTSGGVKVSELETSDSYNRWWYQRWVGARRILD
jgi:cell wall-associated NlpC family hydrolase